MHSDDSAIRFEKFFKLYDMKKSKPENLCIYCNHYQGCKEKDCFYYEKISKGLTCMDLPFGECRMFDNCVCNECINSLNRKYFIWNQTIPSYIKESN